jgi:YbbR domain-containing protein
MKRFGGALVRLLFENFGWKVLSLGIAFAIWVLVASEPELSTFQTVRLEYKNLPEDLEIGSDPVESVVLELRGPSGALRGLGDGIRPSVIVDMSAVQPGQHTFPIGPGNVKVARRIRVVRAIPSEVRMSFEPRATRDVDVQVQFTGERRNGYEVAHYTVNPPRLRIVGPASRVARVKAAVTDPLDVGSAVGPSEFRVNAFLDDPYVRFQTSPQVVVTVTMKKK